MALFPVLVAYAFWDRAVRRGNLPLVAAASYGVPVVSTLLSQWLLDAPVGVWLWIACGLVTVGAVAAQRAVKPDRAADPAPPAEAAA
jgi:drug/metabolite transporter (DMT)-like permease